ncbi:MAG TPA: DUF2080 family transposase-associated protein [Candidatus Nanoarchaeia archaeon]|nr:DUF2080 family transposase-associated protein [Candidatus Nanoarchaeia archaeon]
MQQMIKEQIQKTVVKSGNGGAVWVPKDWLGEKVIVILPEKTKQGMKKQILQLLEPYFQDIVAVGIYGSYARNEQTKWSDIDVLVITNRDVKLSIEKKGIDILSVSMDRISEAIKKYPVLYYNIIQEIEPIINARLFEEARRINISKVGLKEFLKDTQQHTKSNQEFLELDRLDGMFLTSYAVAYSSFLRLKGLFIINCILKGEKFSNKEFKHWMMRQGIAEKEYNIWYSAYKMISDEHEEKELKIGIDLMERILKVTKKEIKHLLGKIGK